MILGVESHSPFPFSPQYGRHKRTVESAGSFNDEKTDSERQLERHYDRYCSPATYSLGVRMQVNSVRPAKTSRLDVFG